MLYSYTGHTNSISSMALSPNGQLLATGGTDSTIIIWDMNTGNQLHQLTEHNKAVTSLDFSADGTMLASCGKDGWIILWDPQTGNLIRKIEVVWSANPSTVALSPDAQQVAAGLGNQYLPIYNTITGELITNLTLGYTSTAGIGSVEFSPDGSYLLGFYNHDEIRMWNVNTLNESWMVQGNYGRSGYVSFHPSGSHFAVAYGDNGIYDNKVELRRSSDGALVREYEAYFVECNSISFSYDGQLLSSGIEDSYGNNFAKIWDVNTGQLLYSVRGSSKVQSVLFTSSDQQIITTMNDVFNNTYNTKLWKLESIWVIMP